MDRWVNSTHRSAFFHKESKMFQYCSDRPPFVEKGPVSVFLWTYIYMLFAECFLSFMYFHHRCFPAALSVSILKSPFKSGPSFCRFWSDELFSTSFTFYKILHPRCITSATFMTNKVKTTNMAGIKVTFSPITLRRNEVLLKEKCEWLKFNFIKHESISGINGIIEQN